jgi:integrase
MKKQSFTKKTLSNIAAPASGRIYVHDGHEKGLSVYVTTSGAVTFFVRKRINGRDERIVIGRFPDISIEQARQKAMEIKSQVALGKDPSEDKKRLRAEITFGEMFHEYMERYSKKQKRSWKFDEREVNKFCSHWFTRKASHISRQEVQILHERVHDNNGLYQANRILERISAIYNRAIRWGWEGTNPARGVKKFKEKSRDRFLKRDEMPRFFAALAEDENEVVRDYILISLLTGARKANVLAMRWNEINFEMQEWRIPETKNGESHTVPLSEQAIEILERRRAATNSMFVFPSNGKTGHYADPKRAWERILKRANIADLRIHDLRRTLGSWMAATGTTTAIIGKTLAHKSVQATKIYERLDLDPVRASVNRATDAIMDSVNNATRRR